MSDSFEHRFEVKVQHIETLRYVNELYLFELCFEWLQIGASFSSAAELGIFARYALVCSHTNDAF